MAIPPSSTLYPARPAGANAPQPFAMFVKLPADVLAAIKLAHGTGVKLSLNAGAMALTVGDESFAISAAPQQAHVDLYKTSHSSTTFTSTGRVSHRLTVKGTAAAASLLKSQNQQLLREKEANKATLLDLPGSRGPSASPSSRPASSTSLKPKRLPLTVVKPLSSMSIHSAPHRAIHLLALAPISPLAMSQKTKIPLAEVETLLGTYGKKVEGDLFTLADARYKDLRVWEWKYSPQQRDHVIAESTKAFDSLGLPADHACRRNLIDPKIKKAEADALAAEKEAKRRAIADAEAAEKLVAERAASERLAAENRQKQAKRAAAAAGAQAVSSPNSHSMLQKVTKIGSTTTKKPRSTSSSSNEAAEPKPRSKPISPVLEPVDGDGPITSSSRGKVKPAAPAPKRKLETSRSSTPTPSTTIRKRIAVGTDTPSPSRSPPRPPRAGPDEDMFALAYLFKQKYSVYEKLYRNVNKAEGGDRQRLGELLTLHRELETVKKRLWAVTPPQGTVGGGAQGERKKVVKRR